MEPDPPRRSPIRQTLRTPLFVAGWVFVVLGLVGIPLPVLPTTPFLLLASVCFARSSERCHRWLLSRPHLGPVILDWERHGAIGGRAKVWATLMLALLIGGTAILAPVALWVRVAVVVTGVLVAVFLLTRPAPPATGASGPPAGPGVE